MLKLSLFQKLQFSAINILVKMQSDFSSIFPIKLGHQQNH